MPATSDTRLLRRRPARRASRAGSTLVGLGFLTILTVAFFGGVVAGRRLSPMPPANGGVPGPQGAQPGSPGGAAAPATTDHAPPTPRARGELRAPSPAASPEPRVTRYTVQVGAFRLREQAEAIRARLAAAGHDAFVADLDSPVATRYRVRVGSYGSRDEARRAAER